MLRLVTLGGLHFADGPAGNGSGGSRSRLSILAVIARGGSSGVRREQLTAMFWPDSDDERARNALRQALYVLRRDMGGIALTTGTTQLRLDPGTVTCDAVDFDRAIAEGRWRDAVDLHAGPFLQGVYLADSPAFNRWAEDERERLSVAFGRAMERLATSASEHGDHASAASWWERRSLHDPYSARVALGYMQALAAIGERERAVRYFATYAARLREDLEVEPEPAVEEAATVLRTVARRSEALGGDALRPTSRTPSPTNGVPDVAPGTLRHDRGRRGSHLPRWLLAVASVGLVGIVASAARARMAPQPPTGVGRRVLVAPFDNRTGDTSLEGLGTMVADFVAQGIQTAGLLEVVDPLTGVLAASPTGSARDPVESAVRAGAGTLVAGAYDRHGDSLIFHAEVFDVPSRRRLAVLTPVTTGRADPGAIAVAVREVVAGALVSHFDLRVSSIGIPLGRMPSLAAYREFRRGLEVFTLNERAALPYFSAALQLDSSFIQPLVWSAFVLGNTGQRVARDSVVRLLVRRRAAAHGLDRTVIDYMAALAAGDWFKAFEAARAAATMSPGSHWSHNASNLLLAQNRVQEALGFSLQVDAEHGWARGWFQYWKNLTNALHLLGRHEEELGAIQRARQINAGDPGLMGYEARALIALGRVTEALTSVDSILTLPKAPFHVDVLQATAEEFRAHGHQEAASRALLLATRLAGESKVDFRREATASRSWRMVEDAWSLYEGGRTTSARTVLDSLPRVGVHPEDAASAALLRDLLGREPSAAMAGGTATRNAYQRALVAAAAGDTATAINNLREILGGYLLPDVPMWIHRDHEWDAFRALPSFRALVTPR